MYCSVSITRPEHYLQAILCKVLFKFESRTSLPFTHNKKSTWLAVGTPNTLEKVWNIVVEREYRKLSYLFQNPERNNGIITESLRQLKMFIHQQSTTIMFHCFFGENLSEFEIAWEVISLLLELLQNVMKQKDEAFAKVVWIQIANLIKMVQFRCGSKFTVLPMDGKNSDQWRWEDPGNREPSQFTGIRKIKRKRKIRDLKTLKVKNPKRPKHQRQHGVIENQTIFN